MKQLLAALAACLAITAQAETVNIVGPVASQVLGVQQYPNVPNDGGIEGLWIRTSAQIGRPDAITVLSAEPDMQCGGTVGAPLTCIVGPPWIMVSIRSHVASRTCTLSGRGQHCSNHWVLDGGTIERP